MRGAPAHALGAIRRSALVALVAGVPLVFLWDVTNVAFEAPKLVLLEVCTAVAGAARTGELLLGTPARGLRRAALPAALVAVPAAVAWLATGYKSWALLGMYGRFGGLVPILLVAAAAVLLADAFGDDPRTPAWALAGAGAAAAFYAVVQSAGLDPFGIPVVEYVTSTAGHSNYLGGFLAIALPVTLGLVTSATGRPRYVAMGFAVLDGLGILLSFSQGGWVAAAAGVAVFAGGLGMVRSRLARPAGWALAGALAAAGVGLVVLSLVDPFNPVVPDTARARGLWWRAAVSTGAESPVWGRGPEVYAIEGPHHRTAADALAHDRTYADQPHSVPLAYFANHGLLGLGGFLLLAAWTLRRAWAAGGDPLLNGFGAGAVAYFTQSLVSIDALVLVVPFWTCVAALARSEPSPDTPPPVRSAARRAAALALIVAVSGAAAWWGGSFLATDARALDAIEAFDGGRTQAGLDAFEDVVRRRDHEGYRHLYGSLLATAALRERGEGAGEIERMRAVFSFVDDFPDVRMLTSYGNGLHQWSVYDPSLEEDALVQLGRALALDEHSPSLRVLVAEAQMRLGQTDDAVATLEEVVPVLEEHSEYVHTQPQVYGALAMAYALGGRTDSAEGALSRAVELEGGAVDECTVLVARELLRVDGGAATRDEYVESSPGLLLCEPATLALLPGYDPQEED